MSTKTNKKQKRRELVKQAVTDRLKTSAAEAGERDRLPVFPSAAAIMYEKGEAWAGDLSNEEFDADVNETLTEIERDEREDGEEPTGEKG